MSRRTEMPYKVDGTDKLAQHSKVRCSVPEVNGAVAQRKFTFLTQGDLCSGHSGNGGRGGLRGSSWGTGVSRGHSTGSNEPATKTSDELTNREGLNLAGSTTMAGRRLALKPDGGAGPRASVAEKECCSILRDCQEPPDADPDVRWCGGREVNPPGYPIRQAIVSKACGTRSGSSTCCARRSNG